MVTKSLETTALKRGEHQGSRPLNSRNNQVSNPPNHRGEHQVSRPIKQEEHHGSRPLNLGKNQVSNPPNHGGEHQVSHPLNRKEHQVWRKQMGVGEPTSCYRPASCHKTCYRPASCRNTWWCRPTAVIPGGVGLLTEGGLRFD